MGWQGKDPSTDFRLDLFSLKPLVHFYFFLIFFHIVAYNLHMTYYYDRGGGFISLENLLYFAGNFPVWSHTQPPHFISSVSAHACMLMYIVWALLFCGTPFLSNKMAIYIRSSTFSCMLLIPVYELDLCYGSVITWESCNWVVSYGLTIFNYILVVCESGIQTVHLNSLECDFLPVSFQLNWDSNFITIKELGGNIIWSLGFLLLNEKLAPLRITIWGKK